MQPSLEQSGYSCNIGNKLLPTKLINQSQIMLNTINTDIRYNNELECNNDLKIKKTNMFYGGVTCQNKPVTITPDGIITPPVISCINMSSPLQFTCQNKPPYGTTTSDGTTTSESKFYCKKAFSDLGLKSVAELGFYVDSKVLDFPIYGTHDGYSYTCASYDGENCIKADTPTQACTTDEYSSRLGSEGIIQYSKITNCIDTNPTELYLFAPQNITCKTSEQQIKNDNTTSKDAKSDNLCSNAFNLLDLYPSSNPFLFRGKNPNQNLTNQVSDPVFLAQFANKYYKFLPNDLNIDINTTDGQNQVVNYFLQQSPLKYGCCLNSSTNTADLKVPMPVPMNPDKLASKENINSKYNYRMGVITIPAQSCSADILKGTDKCDAFVEEISYEKSEEKCDM